LILYQEAKKSYEILLFNPSRLKMQYIPRFLCDLCLQNQKLNFPAVCLADQGLHIEQAWSRFISLTSWYRWPVVRLHAIIISLSLLVGTKTNKAGEIRPTRCYFIFLTTSKGSCPRQMGCNAKKHVNIVRLERTINQLQTLIFNAYA
jgi:hypothetical protein